MWQRILRAVEGFNWKPRPRLPQPVIDTLREQSRMLDMAAERESRYRADYLERSMELLEARQMKGAGPWLVAEQRDSQAPGIEIKESNPITSQGAFGDIELALQNVEWRREINLSWLEFSRWGIQQIILISRLYYIKNPLIRRLINIAAAYVFGRGFEVSSDDDTANDALQEFFTRNKATLGQIALVNLERRKYYDGNLFFAFFTDTVDKGLVTVRDMDATEIFDIVTDPDDADRPRFYKRQWTERRFDEQSGTITVVNETAWYPALQYVQSQPASKPKMIGGYPVRWETPILHRKVGAVAKWHFGCPLIYPAIDWARESKKFLEHCATVKAALAQIAMKFTTKGGQGAIEGFKQQMQTSVGPTSSLWDMNPDATAGATLATGPGTTLEAFNTKGAGGDPEEVRQYKLMCCIVVGVPETFLGDVKTGNLATAASLDRPTELIFMEKQEEWREDLITIAQYVLDTSKGAASGKLRSSLQTLKMSPDDIDHVEIKEAARIQKRTADGSLVWVYEAKKKTDGVIKLRANFPAIREGDVKVLVDALVNAMTLGNKAGQVIGIDEKEGIRRLFELNGFENADELVELMYPDKEYERDRTKEELSDPLQKPQPLAGGQDVVNPKPAAPPKGMKEARELARKAIAAVLEDDGA